MSGIEIVEESVEVLPEYGRIPISFEVRSVFDVELVEGGLGGFRFVERVVERPWIKDYDHCGEAAPDRWPERFDVSHWAFFSAFVHGKRVGGCTVAFKTPGLVMLEERTDFGELWDIRVAPEYRGQGVGKRLFDAAVDWASTRHCVRLKIETQNVNVPACRFYARQGSTLGVVRRKIYRDFPDEVQLIWYKELRG